MTKYDKMPAFGLHELLKSGHKCRQLSEQAPEDPTCPDMDKGYSYYINENGLLFPVPPPDEDGFYSAKMVEIIMERGQIDRIIPLRPKNETKKDQETG